MSTEQAFGALDASRVENHLNFAGLASLLTHQSVLPSIIELSRREDIDT